MNRASLDSRLQILDAAGTVTGSRYLRQVLKHATMPMLLAHRDHGDAPHSQREAARMTTLHLIFVVLALFVYVITSRASAGPRAPTVALAWVFAIIALPYVMLPLYLMFGNRKSLRLPSPALAPPCPHHWASDILAGFGLAPPDAAQVRFHDDGPASREALWSLIDSAIERLDIVTFLVGDDVFGGELARRVRVRVQAGVAVRILIDGVGVLLEGRRARQLLQRAGAEVRLFRPPFRLSVHPLSNLRNHRKYAIADGKRMWAGGRNLAAHYFEETSREPWIDLTFELHGTPVAYALAQFEQDWGTTRKHVHPMAKQSAPRSAQESSVHSTGPGDADWRSRVQFVPSGPDQSHDTLYSVLLAGTFRAERSILIATPYFILDEALKQGLRLAALRGVRIMVVLPVQSNHRIADWARSRTLRELSAAGVQVRCVGGMLHAKVVVIDDSLGMCGSANFDVRSLLLNYESMALFYEGRPGIGRNPAVLA